MYSLFPLALLQVAGMFIYNLLTSLCISYNVIALLCEVNTIFLHSRKLLQMCKFSFTHWLYRSVSQLNLFTFVSCRFVALFWISYGMFIYPERVSAVYFYSLLMSLIVMWPINIILFWRILKNDVLRKFLLTSKAEEPTAQSTDYLYVNNSNNNKVLNGLKSKGHWWIWSCIHVACTHDVHVLYAAQVHVLNFP